MKLTATNPVKASILITLGVAIAAMGIYVAEADDAPGAAVMGAALMVAGVVLGVRAWRNRLPAWAAGTALVVGGVIAAFAASITHAVVVATPLFPQSQEVPSVVGSAPAPQYAAAVERARAAVRAAVLEQNLPGVSIAVGVDGAIVWAEGFGWRDVLAQAPVTPETRFNIGTAASAVTASVTPLGLTHTGTDPVAAWSPSHLGEPEDDFPPFTLIRHLIFRPLGLAPDQPLPDNRASAYVPRSDDNPRRGRREMYMRDMECCPGRTAFYSTPSDLVRLGLATNPGSLNGELAGGMVMSLISRRNGGMAIAVTANIAHANTSALAQQIGAAFEEGR